MTNPFAKKLGQVAAAPAPAPAAQPAQPSALAQRFAAVKPAEQPAAKPNPLARLAQPKPAAAAQPKPEALDSDDFDLNALANSMDEGKSSKPSRPTSSTYSDETPATKPTRELPEELEKGQKQFVDLIDGVYEIYDDPELLGNVIRSIMIELKSNPQYMKLVANDDVRMWVKSMRDSMGLARIRKQESKTKRGSGGGKKKVMDSDMADAFNDLGINLDDL